MEHVYIDSEPRRNGSFDDRGENTVVPIEEHFVNVSQLPTTSSVHEKGQTEECKKDVPWFLTSMSLYIYLAVFGIFGVLSRYLIEKLFGPGVIGATSDHSFIYTDLFPNMVGSFLMGWFGVVFKGDISKFSPQLAVGLTTGYLGSLTTFSGWNQKMIELSVDGHWALSVLGFLLGLVLVAAFFELGVEIGNDLQSAFNKTNLTSKCGFAYITISMCQSILIVVMVTLLGSLWGVGVVLLKKDFNGNSSTSHLWFGCLVGPVGVWTRFYLAKLNGKGLGKQGIMKWMPLGTLSANVAACCIMAALATIKLAVNDNHFDTIATGVQFGFCGCLSTVSTFIAEFEALRKSKHKWRAYVYAVMTIIISFSLSTLIYSVPVWTNGWS